MRVVKKVFIIKSFALFIMLGVFVAAAIPKYLNLNKHREASQCRQSQMIVATALAIAYAESLAVGSNNFPTKLTPEMFDDKIIPTCSIDNTPIEFDPLTGTPYCPHHIESHKRIY